MLLAVTVAAAPAMLAAPAQGAAGANLYIRRRVRARPYFAYSKRDRNDPADPSSFTTPQPAYVVPAEMDGGRDSAFSTAVDYLRQR